MRKKLIFLITVCILASAPCIANELAFTTQETSTSTVYNLQLTDESGTQTIWSREVELINGKKPDDYCGLMSWALNERGLLAIVYFNESFGRLLQFDSSKKLLAQVNIGSKWVQHLKREEEVHLIPPDKIAVVGTDKKIISETIIRDGTLYNTDGTPFVENPLIAMLAAQAQSQTPKAVNTPPVAKPPVAPGGMLSAPEKTPAAFANTGTAQSAPWSIIVVLMVAGCGLLWLLLKRRS